MAKYMVLRCVRTTFLEELHAGKTPASITGDYSDVRVVTPDREIAWNELSRLTDPEMKRFMVEIVDRSYAFLKTVFDEVSGEQMLKLLLTTDLVPEWLDPGETEDHATTRPYPRCPAPHAIGEVNRSAIIVLPKQPFLDWLHFIDPTSTHVKLEDLSREPTIYLVPEFENEQSARECLGVVFARIFDDQLNDWCTDRAVWPTNRTFVTFVSGLTIDSIRGCLISIKLIYERSRSCRVSPCPNPTRIDA
jgi:hypothetical protein